LSRPGLVVSFDGCLPESLCGQAFPVFGSRLNNVVGGSPHPDECIVAELRKFRLYGGIRI